MMNEHLPYGKCFPYKFKYKPKKVLNDKNHKKYDIMNIQKISEVIMKSVIEIKNLYKSYGTVQAVKNLSFKVKEGEFFSFLGINGAGKSTTISIICGILEKNSGTVIVDGVDQNTNSDETKRKIGVVFQNSVLDKQLTVYDNLKIRASLYNIIGKEFEDKLNELKVLLSLEEILNRPIEKLSGGQKRRVDIARALVHNPKILILDEPTTGLDPQTRRIVWDVIKKLQVEKGITVFLTTHYMEEAVESNYIIIINKGEIAAEGTPIELKNKYAVDFISLYNIDEEKVKSLNLNYEIIPNGYKIVVENTEKATQLIINNPDIFKDYEITKGRMDDVFLNVTGIKLGE